MADLGVPGSAVVGVQHRGSRSSWFAASENSAGSGWGRSCRCVVVSHLSYPRSSSYSVFGPLGGETGNSVHDGKRKTGNGERGTVGEREASGRRHGGVEDGNGELVSGSRTGGGHGSGEAGSLRALCQTGCGRISGTRLQGRTRLGPKGRAAPGHVTGRAHTRRAPGQSGSKMQRSQTGRGRAGGSRPDGEADSGDKGGGQNCWGEHNAEREEESRGCAGGEELGAGRERGRGARAREARAGGGSGEAGASRWRCGRRR